MTESNGLPNREEYAFPLNTKTVAILVGVLAIAIALGLALYNFAVLPAITGAKSVVKSAPAAVENVGQKGQETWKNATTSLEDKALEAAQKMVTSKYGARNWGSAVIIPKADWGKYGISSEIPCQVDDLYIVAVRVDNVPAFTDVGVKGGKIVDVANGVMFLSEEKILKAGNPLEKYKR